MKTLCLCIVSLFLMAGCAGLRGPRDPWTKTDTILQVTYTALHVADWAQSNKFARNPNKYYERNVLLGRHPSEGRLNSYMAATLVGQTAISVWLDKLQRTWWQGTTIGVEVYCVYKNQYAVGVTLSW